jgi:hypothetical protein
MARGRPHLKETIGRRPRLTKTSHKPAKASNNRAPIDAAFKRHVRCQGEGPGWNGELKKSPAHAPASAKVHALVREHLVRRGGTATSGPTRRCSRGRACRLRTRGPVTKPTILRKTRIFEALISFLYRPAVDDISLRCSHEGSKRGQSCYHHEKLAHSLPPKFSGLQPKIALILHIQTTWTI